MRGHFPGRGGGGQKILSFSKFHSFLLCNFGLGDGDGEGLLLLRLSASLMHPCGWGWPRARAGQVSALTAQLSKPGFGGLENWGNWEMEGNGGKWGMNGDGNGEIAGTG